MKSDSAAFVKLTFRGYVRLMRLLGGGKRPEINEALLNEYRGSPMFAGCYPVDSKKPAFRIHIGPPNIFPVNALWHIAQIAKAIVRRVPIHVIYLMDRPFSSYVKQSQPVTKLVRASNGYCDVATLCPAPCAHAGPINAGFPGSHEPRKNARLGVVVKKFAQTLRGKIGLSHDAPRKRIGQKPVSVSSTCGLRHFSVGGA